MTSRLLRTIFAMVVAGMSASALGGTSTSFWNGSAGQEDFATTPTKGAVDQVLGLFALQTGGGFCTLEETTITLTAHTGLTNLRLVASTDKLYGGGDTQIGSAIAADPGTSPIWFAQTYTLPNAAGKYYFLLIADVASNATGNLMARVTDSILGGFGFYINFAPPEDMSAFAFGLPVTLSAFQAE